MYRKLLIGCLLLISLASCRKEKQTNVIVNVEDDFYIDMFENISNGEKRFQIDITTIKDQTCLNYQIDHTLDFDNQSKSIELVINDLIEPADCVEGTASARLTVPFGNFGNVVSGTYSFDINLRDAVFNTGRLTVLSDQYLLEMNSHDGIQIVHDRLYRIPQNTVWGYIAYDNSSAETAAQNVMTALENLTSTFSIENNGLYKSGYYGYFDLTEDREILLKGEINFSNHISFLLQHNNLSEVKSFIDNACLQNQDLEIHIFDDNGLDELCAM